MSTKIIAQLNPFSSERKIWNEDDSSISEIIKKIDCQNAVNAGWRILLNDEIITDFSTVTHDGDTVYIKIVPEGDSPKELGAGEKIAGGLLTALGVASFFIPGLGPAVGIALIGSGIGLFANGCVMYNLDLSQKDRESPVQDPSIRGSKNQIRQYGNIPILFGKRRIYPDLATTAYTWVENGQQYLYQLFCCGQKNQTIDTSTIKIGETLLTDYSSSGNIEDVLSGDDSLIQMQIAYGENTPPLLTKCVHEDILNTVLKHQTEDELDGSIIRTTPENTTEINVDIFFYNGLGQYNDDGDVEDCSVTVKAWYKRSDQDDSHYVQLGHFTSDDVITEHELKTKRFSIHKTGLTANSYTVKIERVTEDSDDSKIIDQCYVGSIRAIKNESPVSSARCRQLTLIGLKIKSSEKLNNYIEQLNFISQSSLPCYSGTGSGALQWNNAISSNPASAAIYAMQGEVSQQKLNNSEIDWPAFEKLYTWCNQHEYECNEYLTDSMSISELLSAIGSTCRAEIFRQNGKITVIQDIERDGFVQLFTPRNSWDYEESIAMPDIPDAMALGFVDEEAGYVKQEAKIYNTSNGEKISEPETTQDVTLWGVTSSKQARKLGMYKYAVSRARPIVHKFSADFEYMLCGKGDWIKYGGDIALAGITQGRIASLIINGNTITGFTSDELLLMEDDQSYAVRIRKNDGTAILKNISSHSEDCMTVYFDTAVSLNVLHEGDLFSFGYVGNDSIDLIITDIHCGDNLSAEIIAVEYSPEIFAVDDSGFVLPTFINRITEIPSIEDSGELSDIEEPVKIVTTSILYAASSNGVTPPATGWDSSIPTVTPGNFLWTQTKVFYTDNKSTVSYSVAKQGSTGAKGDKGDTGATGPQGTKGDTGAQGPQGIQGAQGVAGENAIVMTSATTPSGTYTGQIGLWQSQLYKWNGTSWENTSAELPTDAILHYSFDEIPDLPDGQNIILRNKNFTSTSEITSLRASKTITNGILKMQQNVSNVEYGVGFRFGTLDSSDVKNKIVVCKLFVSTSVTGNIYFRSVSHVDSTTFYNQKIEQNKWVTVTFVLPSDARNPWFAIIGLDSSLDNYILFETVYIGDGSYNTPIIDNANGQYNGTNNGGLATLGMSGKGVRFVGNAYIQGNLPFNVDTTYKYTVTAWVRNWDKSTDCQIINNWNTYAVSTLRLRFSANNNTIACDVVYFNTTYNKIYSRRFTYNYPFSTDDLNEYHVVLVADNTNTKLYLNGVELQGTYTISDLSVTVLGRNWFQVGRFYGSSGWAYTKADIDDFQIFNRALTDKEVLGLYLAKGNTPIYYTLKDYQLASIDDDGIISPSEKKQLLAKWHEIYNADNVISALPTSSITAQGEYKSVIDDAVSLGILSITAIDNYRQSANALRDLFWGTNGYLNNLKAQSATRTDINLDNLLANYQKALQDARTAIGQQQSAIASALGVSNSNPFCLIPVNATTGNPDYTNTGTRLQVFNGTTQLTPISSGTLADGEWKVTVTRDHITEGNQTIGDGYIDFGDVSAMTDTHADLTFNIVAKVNGVENTIYTVQKFTQAQEGADGRIYDLRTEQGVVKKSPEGVLTPSSITVQAYSWTASNPPALFGTGDLKAYENNVQVGTTVSQENSIIVSPSGNYPVVVKLFRHGTNTVLDIINIPVLNEVKGNTGETGAQGPQGLKGDTGAKGDKGDKGDTGATGAKGDKGDTGAQGLKGDKGNPGERGSKEFSGTEINNITGSAQTETLTTASSGIDSSDMPIYVGDTYVNTLTNDVWNCTTAGTPSTAKWTYQGRIKSDKDDTNLFRFFDTEHDYTSISNTFTKAVQTAENPFGYNDKILHLTNTNGTQYSRAIPYYKSIRVNSNKKYRYVLYIKQNDSKRRDYFGIVDNQSGGGVTHITSLSGGAVPNGYFGSSTNLGTLGNWYMIVAYVMPYSASTTTAPSDAGVYNCSTKRKIGTTVTNYKWKNDGDFIITHNGTLIRYTDTAKTDTSSADIYDVRFDECNGNEPSIDELLRIDTSVKNKGAWTANTDYYIGDIVSHSGSSYICKTNHNSGSAWATTNWDLLSDKGLDGTDGKKIKVSDYPLRTWDANNWTNYSTAGNTANWTNTDHDFAIGDILIVPAKLSAEGNIIGQSYNEVTGAPYQDGSYWRIPCKVLYGIKGEKGQAGTSSTSVTISKENISVDCLPNHKVMTETSVTISFTGALGSAKKAVTLSKINGIAVTAGMSIVSGLTITSFTNGTDSADGSFTIKMASDGTLGGTTAASDTVIIPIQFTCNGITFVKQLAITKNILSAVIQLSSLSLNFSLRRDGKSNYESKTVNVTVKIGNTERTVTSTTCGTLTGITTSVSSDKKTITINTSSNGNAPNGNLSVSIVSDGVTYTRYISITSSKAGKYLGIATAVSGATVTLKGGSTVTASVGDFITWGGTESSTYHQSYNYQFVRTGSSATSWTSYSDDQDSMTAFSDIMSLLDDASNPNVKANLLVQRLVAADAFIKRLETLSLLFSEYCGSITSQNPSIGDMMIYMGKNPRLTSAAREFQFAISQYLGTRGGQEMWSDKLITKFLASGLLALNLIGCVQATDSVYSRQGEGWKESVDFFKDENNIVTNVVGSKVGGYYAVMDQRGFCYLTEDFISSIKSLSLSSIFSSGEEVLNAGYYNKEKVVVITTHNVYYTEDYHEWNVIQDISKVTKNVNTKCGNWKTPNLFYIKLDTSLYITSNFNSWQEITLPFDGDVYITNKYLIIGSPSSDNLILIDNSLQVSTVANIFKTSTYGNNSIIGVNDNTLIAFGSNGISFANEDITQIQEVSYTPISTIWADVCFYNNRVFFITSGLESRLCYFDLNSPTEIVPTDCIFNFQVGAHALHVTETKGVISVFDTASPNIFYVSFDGGNNFKSIESTDSYRFAGGVFNIEELGLYALIKRDYQWNHKLYTTKGREAGSGIISESIGTENGNIVFSNGLGFKWGNSTPEGASSIVTLPKITPQVVGVGENACNNNTGNNVVGIGNNVLANNVLNNRISIGSRLEYIEIAKDSKEKSVYTQMAAIFDTNNGVISCTGRYGSTIIAYAQINSSNISLYGPDYNQKVTFYANASETAKISQDLQLLILPTITPNNIV